jgi:hypothetical protein
VVSSTRALAMTICAIGVSVSVSMVPVVAFAQAPPADAPVAAPKEVQRSMELFEEGRRLVQGGNCDAAIPKFLESVRFYESIGARLSAAECYATKTPLAAWQQYKQAQLFAARREDERAKFASDGAAALEPRLALFRVAMPSALQLVEIRVDGKTLEPFYLQGGPFAVEPGKHTIEVVANDKRRWSGSIDVKTGSISTVTPDFDKPSAPSQSGTPPIPTTAEGDGSTQRTLGLVIGGVGIVGLGLGAVFGIVASGKLDDAKAACGGYPTCDPQNRTEIDAANDSAKSAALVSTIGFVAGGVALAGGIVLYVTAPKGSGARASIGPMIGQASGCVVTASF